MQSQTANRNSTKFYVTSDGETFDTISKKFGISVEELERLNPLYSRKSRFASGDSVVLSLNDTKLSIGAGAALSATKAGETAKTAIKQMLADSKAQEKAEKAAQQAAQKAKNDAAKKEQYKADIKAAEDNYALDAASAQNDYARKLQQLAGSVRDSRAKLESDLAKQKITESSIAVTENNKLNASTTFSKEAIDADYNEKIKKLTAKLQQTKETKQRKLNALG